MSIAPTQDDVITALRSFLIDRLPEGFDAIAGIENRVSEPSAPNFAVVTLIRTERQSTNLDSPQDVKFTGGISPGTATFEGSIAKGPLEPGEMPYGLLTVSAISAGPIVKGALVAGSGLLDGTFVTDQVSGGAGAEGVYRVSRAQEVLSGDLTCSYGIMTVSAVQMGEIAIGANVYGLGVSTPTVVRALGSGTGQDGTYIVTPAQTVAAPTTLSAGFKLIRMSSTFSFQIDFHSLDPSAASDMAQTISATFRDPYAVDFFTGLSGGTISPLFADGLRLAPFQNENQQFEHRWILEAHLQVNQTTRVPAQYADFATVIPINIDTGPPYP